MYLGGDEFSDAIVCVLIKIVTTINREQAQQTLFYHQRAFKSQSYETRLDAI